MLWPVVVKKSLAFIQHTCRQHKVQINKYQITYKNITDKIK